MATAVAARMVADARMGTRRSARLPPYVPFKLYETSPRKMFNVRKRRKAKGKNPRKPIKVAPNDDDFLDFPFSSVASRSGLFSAGVPSVTSLEPVPASGQATDLADNAAPNSATIAQIASRSGLSSAGGASSTSLGLASAGKPATIPAGNAASDNSTVAQIIPSPAFFKHPDPNRSLRVHQNNLEGAKAMQKDALLFEEAWTLNSYKRRLNRNSLSQIIDKGKMKNTRVSMKPKLRRRVRARSQSVIAMQLGMGLGPHFPPTPPSSRQSTPDLTAGPPTRQNTPAPGPMSGPLMFPGPVPARQNTPQFEDGPVAGPSMHPGALEWRELTPVPTRQNTPQFEPGPSAPLGSRANPVRLDMIEEEPMDIDMEFDPSK